MENGRELVVKKIPKYIQTLHENEDEKKKKGKLGPEFTVIPRLIVSCAARARHFNASEVAARKLTLYQERQNLPQLGFLTLSVTRWLGLFDCLIRDFEVLMYCVVGRVLSRPIPNPTTLVSPSLHKKTNVEPGDTRDPSRVDTCSSTSRSIREKIAEW